MGFWVLGIGPLIAVALALRLRPLYLFILGLLTLGGFLVSFHISESLYPDCGYRCPPMEHHLRWVNGILFTITPALLLLAVFKQAIRADSSFRAKPS